MATTYTVTNDFSANTTAVADDVDQNFTDILTALNAFDASNLASGTIPVARISSLTTAQFAGTALVTSGEGIDSSDDDTSIPTSAAVNDHLESHIGTGAFSPTTVDSDTESFTFPNGLILKMGTVTATTSGTAVVFAAEFPTGTYIAGAFPNNSDNLLQSTGYTGKAAVDSLTTTGMNVSCDGAAYWFATGY